MFLKYRMINFRALGIVFFIIIIIVEVLGQELIIYVYIGPEA